MSGSESHEAGFYSRDDYQYVREDPQRQRRKEEQIRPRPGFLVELSGQAIPLEVVEYRILQFLSQRPYKAFTRKQIALAVTSSDCTVAEEQIDRHVATLRDKLGLFSDYVQSVPYVGYRFKE